MINLYHLPVYYKSLRIADLNVVEALTNGIPSVIKTGRINESGELEISRNPVAINYAQIQIKHSPMRRGIITSPNSLGEFIEIHPRNKELQPHKILSEHHASSLFWDLHLTEKKAQEFLFLGTSKDIVNILKENGFSLMD